MDYGVCIHTLFTVFAPRHDKGLGSNIMSLGFFPFPRELGCLNFAWPLVNLTHPLTYTLFNFTLLSFTKYLFTLLFNFNE